MTRKPVIYALLELGDAAAHRDCGFTVTIPGLAKAEHLLEQEEMGGQKSREL